MADRREELRARFDELARTVRLLEERLARLEAAEARGTEPAPPSLPPSAPAPPAELFPALGLVGRTLVALGGGYLIRAVTEAGTVPPLVGATLGLAYALFWLLIAAHAASRGRRPSAVFHGLAGGLIAYPLLWETTTRMAVLSPPRALVLLVLVFGAGLAVAARHRLGALAWATTLLALGTIASLLLATHHLLGTVLALLSVAAAAELLAFRGLWPALRWPVALLLDASLLALVFLRSRPAGLPEAYPPLPLPLAVAAALLLPALSMAAVGAETLRRRRALSTFGIVQAAVALLLGLGGAGALLARQGVSGAPIGAVSVLLGALCYAAAFAFVERREGTGRNFYFYSTIGALLTLAGTRALLAPMPLGLLWCGLGLASAALGRSFDRMTLRFHGAAYVGLGTLAGGPAGETWRAWLGPARVDWGGPGFARWITTAAALGGYATLAGGWAREPRWWQRLPQALAATVGATLLGGIAVTTLLRITETLAPTEPAAVATIRTGVLAAFATALGALARSGSRRELAWLVWPLLAFGGLKLLAEDLRQGRPVTLFLSLLFYGGALIAAPKLLRRAE